MSKQQPSNFPPGAPPKHLIDFSKALAGEVRILLEEVGKLRDERRALQFEIAELMALKSKHGAGGEYSPGWMPKPDEQPAALPPPEEAPPEGDGVPPAPARPAWRIVHKRKERQPKRITQGADTPASPRSAPAPVPVTPAPAPAPNLPAWAQWRPNPNLSMPMPQREMAVAAPPPRPGLFGPPSPPPQA
ncbi:hypothetical protein PUNSTDRAFT_81104 [Punctularia strigosozonata HHB-11173 SS5]|uniref:uncharacterized protein n=1 Tax=Punctularia strigosozonata (strain HHB-11173) TaxID=741275 RepID=UPI00044175CA|nr:uncharacterized protein PUNSTDRAFT_81104 [Punctularia strigosozonata HHB-11173 SS5]EIN14626.1 hypothetical protein PUNSTDRAFT_81104 [Punctularia strigosozonata HHB-11173 SS5]